MYLGWRDCGNQFTYDVFIVEQLNYSKIGTHELEHIDRSLYVLRNSLYLHEPAAALFVLCDHERGKLKLCPFHVKFFHTAKHVKEALSHDTWVI